MDSARQCRDESRCGDQQVNDGAPVMSSPNHSRRDILCRIGSVLGLASAAGLIADESALASSWVAPKFPNFAPRAKRAVFLFMSGAPPQMDLWDYKPGLEQQFDQDLPASVRGNQTLTGQTAGQARFPVPPAHWGFAQAGATGRWVRELLPYTGKIVDELTVIHSMHTDAINHEPAVLLMTTGNMVPGKPTLGASLSYGLGRVY